MTVMIDILCLNSEPEQNVRENRRKSSVFLHTLLVHKNSETHPGWAFKKPGIF